MVFRYEIAPKQKRPDQIGLRLQCDGQKQADEIHRKLRQAGLRISNLMSATHSEYTHFIYVTLIENDFNNTVLKIEANIKASNDVEKQVGIKDFKSWQNQFRKVIKQLNNDYVSSTSSVQ